MWQRKSDLRLGIAYFGVVNTNFMRTVKTCNLKRPEKCCLDLRSCVVTTLEMLRANLLAEARYGKVSEQPVAGP